MIVAQAWRNTKPNRIGPHSSLAVANEIMAIVGLGAVSPMKLQKLLYFAHGWHLALTGRPLIDETVEAWEYGPVIPSVYHAFKEYGATRIADLYAGVKFDGKGWRIEVPRMQEADSHSRDLLDRILHVYNGYTGVQLSNLTHLPGTPWSKTRESAQGHRSVPIGDGLIREYFLELGKGQSDSTD